MPMRQLRSCDFCGDDAAGVYEVFPSELSPTEAEQHRVVLCSDCVGRLEAVVNPLLERLGVDTGADSPESTPGGSSPPSTASDRPSPTVAPGRRERDREPTAESETDTSPETDSAADLGPSDTDSSGSPSDERTSTGDAAPIHDDESGPSGEHTSSDDESGPSGGSSQPSPAEDDPSPPLGDKRSPSTADESDDSPVEWSTTGPASTDDTLDGSASDPVRNGIPSIKPSDGDDSEPETASTTAETGPADGTDGARTADTGRGDAGSGDGTPDDEPEEFRTVMRLLGNREFPVERDAIVELAASAYELDDAHVRRCLDYAVDRGVIDADGGMLYRG